MRILKFSPSRYPDLAALANALYPGNPTSASEIAEYDQRRDPKFRFQRWMALENGHLVASGNHNQSIWFSHPQKFVLSIGVHPDHQRRGIGSRLYDTILAGLRPFDPLALRAAASSDRPAGIRFLEKRGFQEVIRDIRSELDVQSFDPSRFTGLEDRFQEQGILIKTLPELAGDPDRDRKLYDLDYELSMSVPGDLAATVGRRGLEKYVEYAISGPDAIPEAFFVAVRGDEYVGLSHALTVEKGIILYQGLTGVLPPYRGHGIAMAMKVRAIAYARATRHRTIRADNDARNPPMLAMNEKLGFVRTQELITFEKQLKAIP